MWWLKWSSRVCYLWDDPSLQRVCTRGHCRIVVCHFQHSITHYLLPFSSFQSFLPSIMFSRETSLLCCKERVARRGTKSGHQAVKNRGWCMSHRRENLGAGLPSQLSFQMNITCSFIWAATLRNPLEIPDLQIVGDDKCLLISVTPFESNQLHQCRLPIQKGSGISHTFVHNFKLVYMNTLVYLHTRLFLHDKMYAKI